MERRRRGERIRKKFMKAGQICVPELPRECARAGRGQGTKRRRALHILQRWRRILGDPRRVTGGEFSPYEGKADDVGGVGFRCYFKPNQKFGEERWAHFFRRFTLAAWGVGDALTEDDLQRALGHARHRATGIMLGSAHGTRDACIARR